MTLLEQKKFLLSECWIFTTQELPPKCGFYDVLVDIDGDNKVVRCWYAKEKGFNNPNTVVAWMPSPPNYITE